MKNKNRMKKKVSKMLLWLMLVELVLCIAVLAVLAYMHKEDPKTFAIYAALSSVLFLIVYTVLLALWNIADDYETALESARELTPIYRRTLDAISILPRNDPKSRLVNPETEIEEIRATFKLGEETVQLVFNDLTGESLVGISASDFKDSVANAKDLLQENLEKQQSLAVKEPKSHEFLERVFSCQS